MIKDFSALIDHQFSYDFDSPLLSFFYTYPQEKLVVQHFSKKRRNTSLSFAQTSSIGTSIEYQLVFKQRLISRILNTGWGVGNQVMAMLDRLYGKFDDLTKKHGLFKVLSSCLSSIFISYLKSSTVNDVFSR